MFAQVWIPAEKFCTATPGTWAWWLDPGCWMFGAVEVLLPGLTLALFVARLLWLLRQSQKAGNP